MSTDNYTVTFAVERSPDEVFAAINNVRGWWSGEITGDAERLGAEFTYRVKDVHYSAQRVTEFIPGSKIVWHVTDALLSFVEDTQEWKGTEIIFEIMPSAQGSTVRFTHRGLVPAFACFDACSNGWNMLINNNLRNFILTGAVQPSPW